MFKHGDIVKLKFNRSGVEYYIITDVYDFSANQDESDMHYEIMRMYPITKASSMANVEESKIELLARGKDEDGKIMMDWVIKEREKKGFNGTPDYVEVIKHNLQTMDKLAVKEIKLDIVRYDKLKSVDECLDTINDLNALHKMFGDEVYIQLKEFVIDRAKDLTMN